MKVVEIADESGTKVDEEMKLLEEYLNKLFPENIQKEEELYDPKIIEKLNDLNHSKNLISQKIANLTNKKMTMP